MTHAVELGACGVKVFQHSRKPGYLPYQAVCSLIDTIERSPVAGFPSRFVFLKGDLESGSMNWFELFGGSSCDRPLNRLTKELSLINCAHANG